MTELVRTMRIGETVWEKGLKWIRNNNGWLASDGRMMYSFNRDEQLVSRTDMPRLDVVPVH
jgi:hypothetical protein